VAFVTLLTTSVKESILLIQLQMNILTVACH
jgi:hypothetical protein